MIKIDLRQESFDTFVDLFLPTGTAEMRAKWGKRLEMANRVEKVWYQTVNVFEKGTLALAGAGVAVAEYFAHDHVSAAIWPLAIYLISGTVQRWTRENINK